MVMVRAIGLFPPEGMAQAAEATAGEVGEGRFWLFRLGHEIGVIRIFCGRDEDSSCIVCGHMVIAQSL